MVDVGGGIGIRVMEDNAEATAADAAWASPPARLPPNAPIIFGGGIGGGPRGVSPISDGSILLRASISLKKASISCVGDTPAASPADDDCDDVAVVVPALLSVSMLDSPPVVCAAAAGCDCIAAPEDDAAAEAVVVLELLSN